MRITPAFCDRAFSDQALCDQAVRPDVRRWASGVASLDAALAGGLGYGYVHEIYAAQTADAAAAAGFGAALTAGMAAGKAVLWLRSRRAAGLGGVLQGGGWAELGGAPDHGLVGVVPDAMALLQAAVDAVRCRVLGAVIVEGWGRLPELNLTASRRLALAAERSAVPVFVLRIDAKPVPSAAQTRWQVAAAPSQALPGNAPGLPTFDIALLRQRSGPSGLDWRVEWDRDRCKFRDPAVSGAVVSVPSGRPAAGRGAGALRPDDNRRAA
ncbi:MAG: hypothetical protein RLZZ84_154 [Pseudomonadota bacterium]|jgi:protein ImuA